MTCDLILEWLDDYLDDQLSEQNRKTMERHLEECEACKMLVQDMKSMREVMRDMPMMALPTDFSETLHEKLCVAAEEMKAEQKDKGKLLNFPMKFKHFGKYAGAAAALVIFAASGMQLKDSLLLNQQQTEQAAYDIADAGGPVEVPPMISNTAADQTATAKSMAAPAAGPTPESAAGIGTATDGSSVVLGSSGGTAGQAPVDQSAISGRDLIRSGDISIKVAKYEDFYKAVEAMMSQTGGYIESSYSGLSPYFENNKQVGSQLVGSMVLRIPSAQFGAVFESIKSMGVLQSSQQNVVDVTSQLSDLRASLENLKVRETRLRELMSQAKNVTEVMAVEKELGAVRTQIDQLEASLKQQTQQVSLSTLYVNVQESPEVGSQFAAIDGNLFERAKQALIKNINDGIRWAEVGFVFLVSWLPAVLAAALAFFAITRTKSYKRWRQKK